MRRYRTITRWRQLTLFLNIAVLALAMIAISSDKVSFAQDDQQERKTKVTVKLTRDGVPVSDEEGYLLYSIDTGDIAFRNGIAVIEVSSPNKQEITVKITTREEYQKPFYLRDGWSLDIPSSGGKSSNFNLSFNLIGKAVKGKIITASGKPLRGAYIYASLKEPLPLGKPREHGEVTVVFKKVAITDESGCFEMKDLLEGIYRLYIGPKIDYYHKVNNKEFAMLKRGWMIVFSDKEPVIAPPLIIEYDYTVSVSVKEDGKPLANLQVSYEVQWGQITWEEEESAFKISTISLNTGETVSNKDGIIHFNAPPKSVVRIVINHPRLGKLCTKGYIIGEEKKIKINCEIPEESELGHIQIKVEDFDEIKTGNGIIWMWGLAPDFDFTYPKTPLLSEKSGLLEESGEFEIRNICPGRYAIFIRAFDEEGNPLPEPPPTQHVKVEVKPGTTQQISIKLREKQ